MEDSAQFDRASIESICVYFEAWVDAQEQRDSLNKCRMCIVIDEESLQMLLGTSAEALKKEDPYHPDETLRYVKVLEAWPIIHHLTLSRVLLDLWPTMCDGDEMRMSFENID
ncbi:hypothetical protein EYZ11_006253 [Aspergillus tanneri]|uniref:Uncharacterized protein n=1 Tax=Aspergillus tanneri TaxID=1220188 RepID=A0A4S3JGC8_9EURO|nr:hypothetical protein EYZ11_006253 [Aspergillus tanneri]